MRRIIADVGDMVSVVYKQGISLRISAVALLLGFSLVGCSATVGTFTFISTRNVDWSRASEFNRSNQRVIGKDIAHLIIFIPTGTVTIPEAVDNALKQIPGAIAMVDAVVKQRFFYIPYIYGQIGLYVEGNVLVDPKLALLYNDSSNYLVLYTEDGKNFKKRAVSEAEYLTYVK